MSTKPSVFMDHETGEYFEYHRSELPRRRSPFGKRWFKMAFEANIQLAMLDGVHATDFRVFHMLLPTIQNGSQIYVNITALAKQLRITVPMVSRSIRKLIEKGVIARVEGNARVYELNPTFGWYGADNAGHLKAIKQWQAAHLLQ